MIRKSKIRKLNPFLQEHKCVLDSCRVLSGDGFKVTYLPVSKGGLVDLEELDAAMTPDTSLVSIMLVNNEIGVVQPIEKIGIYSKTQAPVFLY
jgi:cysteine desulfurase